MYGFSPKHVLQTIGKSVSSQPNQKEKNKNKIKKPYLFNPDLIPKPLSPILDT